MPTISVNGVQCEYAELDPQLDVAFQRFYESVLSGQQPDPVTFDALVTPFLAKATTHIEHDAYFNNFTPLWSIRLRSGQGKAAAVVWPWALRPVLAFEQSSGRQIHKGTPYYFWGMTSLLGDNLEEGYLLMHRALEEDFRTHGSKAPATPGWALATLDHDRQDQAFLPWVQMQGSAVDARLTAYRQAHQRTLDLQALRTRFLAVPEYRDAVQLFCYSMARARRLAAMPTELWAGPFPAQLAFDTLFDLCLVVDAALHEKNRQQWQFIDHATMLSARAQLGLSSADLGALNGTFRANFAGTLRSALGGTLTLPAGRGVTGLANALAITYGCRNRGAHNVSAIPLTPDEYSRIVQAINDVLFVTIEALY